MCTCTGVYNVHTDMQRHKVATNSANCETNAWTKSPQSLNKEDHLLSCKFTQVREITLERGLTQNVNNFEKVQIYLLCNYSHRGTCFLF